MVSPSPASPSQAWTTKKNKQKSTKITKKKQKGARKKMRNSKSDFVKRFTLKR